jgi:hypothetical protein
METLHSKRVNLFLNWYHKSGLQISIEGKYLTKLYFDAHFTLIFRFTGIQIKCICLCFNISRTISFMHKKVKVKFALEQSMNTRRGSRGNRFTLSLTSALDGGGWLTVRPGSFTPGMRFCTPRIGDWVGPRVNLSGCLKSRSHRDPIPGPSSESLYLLGYAGRSILIMSLYLTKQLKSWTSRRNLRTGKFTRNIQITFVCFLSSDKILFV